MSRIRNALTARERLIWYLVMVLVLLAVLFAHAHWRLATVQQKFTMHVPPDLSEGAVLRPDTPTESNIYMYSKYIWRVINEWRNEGSEDYKAAIEAMECYVSPAFYKELQEDFERRKDDGELSRTRLITPSNFYTDEYVEPEGNGTWYVWLDVKLVERVLGEKVKDVVMRYPLYAYRDGRSCNEFGVSLGGFFSDPKRLKTHKETSS